MYESLKCEEFEIYKFSSTPKRREKKIKPIKK